MFRARFMESWGILIWSCRNEKLQVSQNVSESMNMGGVRLGKSRGVSNHVGEEACHCLHQPDLGKFIFVVGDIKKNAIAKDFEAT